jgi:glyoxylate carboligase
VNRLTKRFVFHYVEMVLAMVVGMLLLGGLSEVLLDLPDETAVTLVEMAIAMTVPMVAWMRYRGHGWRATNEMAAAMIIPAVGALVLLGAGIVTDEGTLMMIEHTAMFVGMFGAMLWRHEEYTGHHHHVTQETPA